MTWQPDYATLAELKAYLVIGDTNDDVNAATAVTAASRAIDANANRQFGLTGSAVARYYTYARLCIDGRPALRIDDLMTSAGLLVAVDSGTEGTYVGAMVLGTDYDLWPRNAAADGVPWTHIVLRRSPAFWFPLWASGIRITANWGWTTVPTAIHQAALIQAGRYFVRKDSLYGVAGSPDIGSEVRLLARLDPDVALTVSAYKRWWSVI